jgi:hypothetical protein
VVDTTDMEEKKSEEKKSTTKFTKSVITEKECTVLVILTTGKSSTGTSKVTYEKDNAARIKSDITRPNKPSAGTDNKGLEDKITEITADEKGSKEPVILTGIPSGSNGIGDTAKLTGIPAAFEDFVQEQGIPSAFRTLPIPNKEDQAISTLRRTGVMTGSDQRPRRRRMYSKTQ